ncbi:MAG TPA: TIGR03621 family F420-dependent LLM class oxidoreductase [Terriglobales bacterium]|nr:TIGR03621 family F420-dependent LLM class oxidoreductase [Terriglobales bacterium]
MARHDRRFRFAVQVGTAGGGQQWADLAREAESLGYSVLTMPDHFGDQFAVGPALAAAAAATETLRLGALVYDNDYRHPVLLAKEVATLDVLSGGRVELGLGAGWLTTDYEQSGIPCDPIGVRIDRMVEGLRVLRGLMAEGPFTFAGEHYRIAELDGQPKPVQRPHPPVLIGGGGRRILSIAGREADIVGIGTNLRSGRIGPHLVDNVTADATAQKVSWVREAAGDRFDQLELHMQVFLLTLTDDRAAAAAGVAQFMETTVDEVLSAPIVLMGTEQEVVDQIRRQREMYGISHLTVGQPSMRAFAPIVARLAGT